MKRIFQSLCFALSVTSHSFSSEDFQILTQDASTSLSGQIDFPTDTSPKASILMVPGTGLFDRDVELSYSGSPEDLLFKKISSTLTQAGFAVIRFDSRGVKCHSQNMPPCPNCKDKRELGAHYVQSCIDTTIRHGVTPENIRDDIETVYKHMRAHPILKDSKTLILGHSEGSIHLSHLIEDQRIQPNAALFIGGVIASPASTLRWQITERLEDGIFSFDRDKDGIVTNEEIEAGHKETSSFLKHFPLANLLSPEGEWTRAKLRNLLENNYQTARKDALERSDLEPYSIQASYRWWKMYFTDTTPGIQRLKHFGGNLAYLQGTNDSQTPFHQQKDAFNDAIPGFRKLPKLIEVKNVGHILGNDETVGPILSESLTLISNTCTELLE